jgi:hypothetical protein
MATIPSTELGRVTYTDMSLQTRGTSVRSEITCWVVTDPLRLAVLEWVQMKAEGFVLFSCHLH